MARSRKIKPGYNSSPAIAKVSFGARVLDQNLWPHLDGNGMIQDAPAVIKGLIFPQDDITAAQVTGLIMELVRAGRLFSLEVDRKRWLYRKDFRTEQRIYPDEKKLCQVDPKLLDRLDRGESLPQLQVFEEEGQPQLFATSSPSSSSTSTSSVSETWKNEEKVNETWVKPPPGLFERWKRKAFAPRDKIQIETA